MKLFIIFILGVIIGATPIPQELLKLLIRTIDKHIILPIERRNYNRFKELQDNVSEIKEYFNLSATDIADEADVERRLILCIERYSVVDLSAKEKRKLKAFVKPRLVAMGQLLSVGITKPEMVIYSKFFDGRSAIDLYMRGMRLNEKQLDLLKKSYDDRIEEQRKSLESIKDREPREDGELDFPLSTMNEDD